MVAGFQSCIPILVCSVGARSWWWGPRIWGYGVFAELREGWRASNSPHLHPAVSVTSSSLTMSGTVALAVLGCQIQFTCVRASCGAVELAGIGIYLCSCAAVGWRLQHESPLLLSPRGERDLFADLPILGGHCCDLESHRCAGRHRSGRCSSIIARTLACKQVAALSWWRIGNYPPPCRYDTTPGPVLSFVGAWDRRGYGTLYGPGCAFNYTNPGVK